MRLFMDPLPLGEVEIKGKDLQHIKVRRLQSGDEVEIIDGRGSWVSGILQIESKKVVINLERNGVFPAFEAKIDCVLAIPQSQETYFNLLPSLVQIGVGQIGLLQTHWSGSLKKKKEKFDQKQLLIAQESLKQSGRGWMPQFEHYKDWKTALNAKKANQNVLLHPSENQLGSLKLANKVCFWVGPEAGFHKDEVEQARIAGFHICSVGPFIQRMETAVIGACFWGQNNV